jgi:hypothetical protein
MLDVGGGRPSSLNPTHALQSRCAAAAKPAGDATAAPPKATVYHLGRLSFAIPSNTDIRLGPTEDNYSPVGSRL